MPAMFQADPYSECFEVEDIKFTRTAYCIVDVYVKPNRSSRMWKVFEESSRHWKTQYHHEHLVRGICVNRCRKLFSRFAKASQFDYFALKPENFSRITTDPFIFHRSIEDNLEYREIVNECINYEMMKQFQMEAYSDIQYCEVKGRVDEIGRIPGTFNFILLNNVFRRTG